MISSIAALIDGKKSYILGGLMILIGIAELFGIDVIEPVTPANAWNYILAGWGVIAGKSALTKTA